MQGIGGSVRREAAASSALVKVKAKASRSRKTHRRHAMASLDMAIGFDGTVHCEDWESIYIYRHIYIDQGGFEIEMI